jgi:methyl-accepting chemotaxis protein
MEFMNVLKKLKTIRFLQPNSIQFKVTLLGGASLFLMAASLITYAVLTLRSTSLAAAEREAHNAADSQAEAIAVEINKALFSARTLAQAFSAMKSQDIRLDRAQVIAMLKQVLADNPQFVGVYTLWEQNAFDGEDMWYVNATGHDETGRFIPYWSRSGDQITLAPLLDYEVEGAGDYYLVPKHTKQEAIIEPYIYPINGQDVLITSLVAPIVVEGKFYGITGIDLALAFLQELADRVDVFDKSGELVLYSHHGTLSAVTGKAELVNTSIRDFSEDWEEELELIQLGEEFSEQENGIMEIYVPIRFGEAPTPWSANLNIPVRVITAEANASMWRMIGIGIVLAIIAQALLWFSISRSISAPIARLTRAASNIGLSGDLNRDIPIERKNQSIAQGGEIGQLARALIGIETFLVNLSDLASRVAEGDLTLEIEPISEKDELGNAFKGMVENLRTLVGEVVESANSLGAASNQLAAAANQAGQATSQISATIQQIAKGTTQQSESVSRTATSVEQMSRAIDGVARGAQDQTLAVTKAAQITSQLAIAIEQVSANAQAGANGTQKAAKIAQGGTETVTATLKGMEAIQDKVNLSAQKVEEMGHRSQQIGVIVETIEDIASQTNLLALNAAIEAARAGEHGKGFAVVADEVRKLAERASTATKEIGGLVKDIQSTVSNAVIAMNEGSAQVEHGVRQANEAGLALEEILTAAKDVNRQVVKIAEAAEQMSGLSNELVAATDAVSAVVEENTAATEEMAAGSSEMTQAIENIASVSEENSAAVEEVSASAEEMSAQVEEVTASAQSLAEMAQALQSIVARFKLSEMAQTGKPNWELPTSDRS